MKKKNSLFSAGGIAKEILGKRGMANQLVIENLIVAWQDIVGKNIFTHSSPVQLRSKKLYIAVDSPVWSHQLSFFKGDIINRVNNFFKDELVNDVRFNVAVIDKQKTEKTPLKKVVKPLTNADEKFIDDTLDCLSDPDLKKVLKKLMSKDIANKK